jgi:hypothetical protein
MIFNYFKIAFRYLIKNRTFSVINIFGLTIGFLCFLTIALYLNDELNFDMFHVTSIATLLSKDFIVLVVIAGLFAWPVAYYAMDKWLQGFANHISLTEASWTFIAAAVLSVMFALITTGLQSIKAGLANPIDSLKNE